jgi:hypothetical protein
MADLLEIKRKPVESAIRMVEELLGRVRSGEVTAVVLVQSYSDGYTSHCWAGVKHNSVKITGELMCAATALAGHVNNDRD